MLLLLLLMVIKMKKTMIKLELNNCELIEDIGKPVTCSAR